MTTSLGPHAGYIVASYAMAVIVMAGLVIWSLAADRAARRDVERLDDLRREQP
jgi:heme exporter protein D